MTVEFYKTRLKLNVSFVALVCLMLIFCQKRIVIISLFSSVCHECGHLVFMYIFRDVPQMITVSAFGMRIDKKNGLLPYKHEAVIAMGGIFVNIIIVLICFLMYTFSGCLIMAETAFVNLFIAFINTVPVGMLDFARTINCLLLMKNDIKKAQRISDVISAVSVAVFVVFCIVYCVFVKVNISLICITVYLLTSYKKRS